MRLRGRCVLIVEDEYLLADELARDLVEAGVVIVGPVSSIRDAHAMISDRRIDGAVLDINLRGETVYSVAAALIDRRVPIVFVTGYDESTIPRRYADVPLCQKPVSSDAIIEALHRAGA